MDIGKEGIDQELFNESQNHIDNVVMVSNDMITGPVKGGPGDLQNSQRNGNTLEHHGKGGENVFAMLHAAPRTDSNKRVDVLPT
ncbi:unnamed protein product [Bursaphelenchus xylophilus]|uniref:(pine wood nematode) hypothetical protein n=1 Tax=Bursaphelenchus xylophilus TaxID=6326 RepID=A0A1I7RU86_BURXY|nr:unnamed protein product [Bursaphelenchus xylophilus]CAG9113924.1 unnamed protein product [Bursaphelenchus xylophilus]